MYARKAMTQATSGTTSSSAAEGSRSISSTADSPRHAVDTAPTSEITSVVESCGAFRRPSATPMIAETRPTPVVCATAAATSASSQRCGRLSPGAPSVRKTNSATPVHSGSSAMLKESLIGRCCRFTASAMVAPIVWPISRLAGEARKSPSTNPISVSESVCACLRNCRCTTNTSAR